MRVVSKAGFLLGAALALTAGLVKIFFLQECEEEREGLTVLPPERDHESKAAPQSLAA